MRIISDRTFAGIRGARLRRPTRTSWDYAITLPAHYMLPATCELAALHAATRGLFTVVGATGPFYVFTNGWVGWRRLSATPRSVVRADTAEEVIAVIEKHSHFRRRKMEDYYISDRTFSWIALYSHNDTWHLWLDGAVARLRRTRAWLSVLQVERLPRWPVWENPQLVPFR